MLKNFFIPDLMHGTPVGPFNFIVLLKPDPSAFLVREVREVLKWKRPPIKGG